MTLPGHLFPTAPRRGTASALNWVGEHLAVVGPDPGGAITSMASLLPAEPGVVTVVGQLAGPADWALITEVLPIAVPPGAAARLAVSGAGMSTAKGAPAADLAAQLQADVYAPNGQLLLVPGGGMFAVDEWRWFTADGQVRQGGRRHPRPAWEAEADMLVRHATPGIRAYAIPAGIWLFADVPGMPDPDLDDLVLAVPMDMERVTVVIGRPGTPPPGVDACLSVIEALDPSMVLAPYGGTATEALRIAEIIAERWDRPVEIATGLPTLDDEYRLVSVAVDPDGGSWWTPPVSRLRCVPGVPPAPAGRLDLLADLRPAGPDAYRVNERWVVEPTQFGLWVRPPFAGQHVSEVRRREWQPDRLVIAVGLPGLPLPDDVLPVLHALLNRLTDDVRARVEFVPEELNHLVEPDSEDRPELVLAAQRSTPPRWWRRDDRLFAVLLTVDGPTGMVRTDAGEVEPGQLGDIIATHRDPDPRPVLLVASAPVAPEVEQHLADQLQAVTIGRRADGWWASTPRRIGREDRPGVKLETGFPFSDDDLDAALTPPRAVPHRAPAHPADEEPLLSLAPSPPAAPARPPGARTVVVQRGPDWRRPFRLGGQPVTAWELALTVAERRPGWVGERDVIWLEAGEVAEPLLRLLANYLGAPVGARARLVPDASPAARASGWCAVRPRTPQP
ncbi:hypothetical protein [Catenuloplanes atrovinosus]|uniref:Uncharacterized protein n=1 Tax=Catenuloplanes atrovinosus TaxID=137266 RepID=A0AAE3YL89_9ACTN|nr:hypothetical protein [Catenuloplanes atrovinosus]MDR7274278.1 hypothetical protein [Catenuloplanes atrovinosus]